MAASYQFGQMNTGAATDGSETRRGWICALGAFLGWGLVPIFFRTIEEAGAWQIIAHRVLWTGVLLTAILWATGQLHQLREVRGRWLLYIGSTILITANWSTYIWAALSGHIVQASLGYFMTPLVNVVIGVVFLQERLRRAQIVAVLIAGAGVAVSAVAAGVVPWLSLALANSWAFYSLLHKKYRMHPIAGLSIETLLLVPFCVAYVVWLGMIGEGDFGPTAIGGSGAYMSLMLIVAGIVTAAPLVLFMTAAKHLPLTSLGIAQYLAPSLQFLIAVGLYGEPFGLPQAITFGCIWTGLGIFSWDALRNRAAPAVPARSSSQAT